MLYKTICLVCYSILSDQWIVISKKFNEVVNRCAKSSQGWGLFSLWSLVQVRLSDVKEIP